MMTFSTYLKWRESFAFQWVGCERKPKLAECHVFELAASCYSMRLRSGAFFWIGQPMPNLKRWRQLMRDAALLDAAMPAPDMAKLAAAIARRSILPGAKFLREC